MEMERTILQNEQEEFSASVNTLEQTIKLITSARYKAYYYNDYHYDHHHLETSLLRRS